VKYRITVMCGEFETIWRNVMLFAVATDDQCLVLSQDFPVTQMVVQGHQGRMELVKNTTCHLIMLEDFWCMLNLMTPTSPMLV